ncbi:HipA N-terminal domain-containing protein [Phyllobacterium zundukense]|uniref:HipA N-terminal domain-containing protein n=1 Tax=Phyllobacterium zundukense TaxID=1867719 RepID=UPI001F344D96|nr:HipA N-terminal domain-containing protein [Phyllobacterium zundukense]
MDFQYTRDWLEWRGTFPVSLSLPLREDRYIGAGHQCLRQPAARQQLRSQARRRSAVPVRRHRPGCHIVPKQLP